MRVLTSKIIICLFTFFISTKASAQVFPAKEFKKLLVEEKGVLIDVRTPQEYEAEHIAGAINIDVQDPSFKDKIEKADKSKSYFIYCRIGRRSVKAINIMKQAGFTLVYDLEGGITEWKKQGFPIKKT